MLGTEQVCNGWTNQQYSPYTGKQQQAKGDANGNGSEGWLC